MPSSDSMFGMDDESCFLCGGTVFAYESTATWAMLGCWNAGCVVGYGESQSGTRTTAIHDRFDAEMQCWMGCHLSLVTCLSDVLTALCHSTWRRRLRAPTLPWQQLLPKFGLPRRALGLTLASSFLSTADRAIGNEPPEQR